MKERIGFMDKKNKDKESIYNKYLGKPGQYTVGNVSSLGILHKIDVEKGYFLIKPSIVPMPVDKIRIETEMPTMITGINDLQIVIEPLKEGDLEQYVKLNNKDQIKK